MSNVKKYADLLRENHSLTEIAKGAQSICERRGKYAKALIKKVKLIQTEKAEIDNIISTINENSSVLGLEQRQKLTELCNSLTTNLNQYVNNSEQLCKRFENKKIKLLAFGQASEGKSTFTRLYTGLPQTIIAVKDSKNGQDKTGALSIIYHDSNYTRDEPRIVVHFKTQDEVLTIVNSCIKWLNQLKSFSLPKASADGYPSWHTFSSVINDPQLKGTAYSIVKNSQNEAVNEFTPIKSFLSSVFEKESNFDKVKAQSYSEEITLQDLPMYNDMTNQNQRKHLSVKHIDIYADLENENVFENFEICDSKGISATAGGKLVEDDLFYEIKNSDAVFSIKKVGQSLNGADFYSNLSNSIINRNNGIQSEDFRNKHFAILNLYETDDETISQTINTIVENKLANCVYVGSLKEIHYDGDTINPKQFAQSVIIDMLSRIVESTQDGDDSLIKQCNELVLTIKKNIKDLVDFLSQLQNKAEECNIETILLHKIDALRISAIEELDRLAKDKNISLSDTETGGSKSIAKGSSSQATPPDWFTNHGPQKEISSSSSVLQQEVLKTNTEEQASESDIFRMITGRYNLTDDEVSEILKSQKYSDISFVEGIAISYIYDTDIKPIAGSNVFMGPSRSDAIEVNGTPNTIGGYIDSICSLLYDRIGKNINEEYSASKRIDSIATLNDEVYSMVWNVLKLNSLLGDFSGQILAHSNNEVVKEMNIMYNKLKLENEGSSITPEMSYNILKAYFTDESIEYQTISELPITNPIINEGILKKSICKVYRRFDFKQRYLEKQVNEQKLKSNIFIDLKGVLTNGGFISGIKELFPRNPESLYNAGVISKEESVKVSHQENWNNLNQTRTQLNEKSITTLDVIN